MEIKVVEIDTEIITLNGRKDFRILFKVVHFINRQLDFPPSELKLIFEQPDY